MTSQVVNANKTVPFRARGYAAQLRSLSAISQLTNTDLTTEESGTVKINFPSMPEEIDLTRVSDYTVHNNQALPDAFHVYKHTNPLEIALSFELSAFDRDYVLDGPIGLMVIGAKLHSLTLPIIQPFGVLTEREAPAPAQNNTESGMAERADSANRNENQSEFRTQAPFFFPPACVLDLITGYEGGHGIRCLGYVQRASIKLRGPWLTSSPGRFKNLPSSAKFEFTFVHAPSFTNAFASGDFSNQQIQTVQAGARDVFQSFYNTLDLSAKANLGFAGLDEFDSPILRAADAAIQ